MKNLFMIGGTMGVGKTTVSRLLRDKLDRFVFVDGDWCWDMHPFCVDGDTKKLVEDNICALLDNDLHCTAFDNIVFCWVMHEQSILDGILARLDTSNCRVIPVSLVCRADALAERLRKDVETGLRREDVIARSLARIPLYEKLNTYKLDVSELTPKEAAEKLLELV